MTFVSAYWTDAEQTTIVAVDSEGGEVSIPADVTNRDYTNIVLGGDDQEVLEITAWAPTAENVRIEAARRILAEYLEWKQLNLIRKGGATLTAMSDRIDAIRAASNLMEPSPPSDYTDDTNWPS